MFHIGGNKMNNVSELLQEQKILKARIEELIYGINRLL